MDVKMAVKKLALEQLIMSVLYHQYRHHFLSNWRHFTPLLSSPLPSLPPSLPYDWCEYYQSTWSIFVVVSNSSSPETCRWKALSLSLSLSLVMSLACLPPFTSIVFFWIRLTFHMLSPLSHSLCVVLCLSPHQTNQLYCLLLSFH